MREKAPSFWDLYFAASYVWVILNLLPSLGWSSLGWEARTFQFLVLVTYGALYLFPAVALTFLVGRTVRAAGLVHAVVAIGSVGIVQTFLFADRTIYSIFDFHINGFVWNLVTTRGGIASMGAGLSSMLSFSLIVAGIFLLQIATWLFVKRLVRQRQRITTTCDG